MSSHSDYKFSVTVHTDDLAVVGCLRALSQHAQATGNPRIPWGGTKREDWEEDRHHATFHFSAARYRENFLTESRRLLPVELWRVTAQNDDDPASPQS